LPFLVLKRLASVVRLRPPLRCPRLWGRDLKASSPKAQEKHIVGRMGASRGLVARGGVSTLDKVRKPGKRWLELSRNSPSSSSLVLARVAALARVFPSPPRTLLQRWRQWELARADHSRDTERRPTCAPDHWDVRRTSRQRARCTRDTRADHVSPRLLPTLSVRYPRSTLLTALRITEA